MWGDAEVNEGDKIELKAFKSIATDYNTDGVKDFSSCAALMESGRVSLADADLDGSVDDVVIDASASPEIGTAQVPHGRSALPAGRLRRRLPVFPRLQRGELPR